MEKKSIQVKNETTDLVSQQFPELLDNLEGEFVENFFPPK